MYLKQKIILFILMVKSILIFCRNELRRGTLFKNLPGLLKSEIREEMSWAELLEEKARLYGKRTFLEFIPDNSTYSYYDMNEDANRVANFLLRNGGKQSKGLAMIMGNSPAFLHVFFATQKIGMYSVPVNVSLRGDGLLYILNHSEAEILVIDDEYLDHFIKIADKLEKIRCVIVNPGKSLNIIPPVGKKYLRLPDAYKESSLKPVSSYNKDDVCFILYTSGTTGLPKGVTYRYRKTTVKLLSIAANILLNKNDVLYTGLPVFHGNALFLTITNAMHVGARVVLASRFSASTFWNDIRKYGVTQFNTIGAMISILMKQPENPLDDKNRVRFTLSGACPAEYWEKFEKRFGIKIYEAYGAVDGGGKSVVNFGTAPVGSIGKPIGGRYRLVDNALNDVAIGQPGELIFKAVQKGKSIEYFKNENATNDKLRNGWIFTGDLVRQDKKGYLYFVGRNTESMRIRGENVSAYEVEHAILKHPEIVEAAVYAVPSELAEDDIMASVLPVNGKKLKEQDLVDFLRENLAKFAIPRYVKIVEEFPKTETQRIIKKELEKKGVVQGTYDSAKGAYR